MRLLIIAILAIGSAFGMLIDRPATSEWVSIADLPREARQTLVLIKNGGRFPTVAMALPSATLKSSFPRNHAAITTNTRSRLLRNDRGPRRIISGQRGEFYYTDDHYKSFRRIKE
jgi:ribonuclease T1